MSGLGGRAHDRRGLYDDIKYLRLRGLTVDQVAQRLGISRATIYRVLKEGSK